MIKREILTCHEVLYTKLVRVISSCFAIKMLSKNLKCRLPYVAEHNQMTDDWIHWILHALKSEVNNGLVGMDPVIPTFTFPDESLFLTPTNTFVPFLTNCAEQHSVKYPPVLDRY